MATIYNFPQIKDIFIIIFFFLETSKIDLSLGLTPEDIKKRVKEEVKHGVNEELALAHYEDDAGDPHWYRNGCVWYQYK